MLAEQQTIWQAGKLVVPCHVRQPLLGSTALADILVGRHPATAGNWFLRHGNAAPVREVAGQGLDVAITGNVEQDVEARAAQHVRRGAAEGGHAKHIRKAAVRDHQPPVCAEQAKPLAHIGQRCLHLRVLGRDLAGVVGRLLGEQRLDARHGGSDVGLHDRKCREQVGGLAFPSHMDRIVQTAAGDGLGDAHGMPDRRCDAARDDRGDGQGRKQADGDRRPGLHGLPSYQFAGAAPIPKSVAGKGFDERVEPVHSRCHRARVRVQVRQQGGHAGAQGRSGSPGRRRNRAFLNQVEIVQDFLCDRTGIERLLAGQVGAARIRRETREIELRFTEITDRHEGVVVNVQRHHTETAALQLRENAQQARNECQRETADGNGGADRHQE